MKIFELQYEPASLEKLKPFIHEIRVLLGTNKCEAPKIHLNNDNLIRWLGQARWPFMAIPTTILIQKRAMIDMQTAKRIMAHELCHDAVNQLIYRPVLMKLLLSSSYEKQEEARKKFIENDIDSSHGKNFQSFADIVNQKFGDNYVTEKSDESYVIRQPRQVKYNSKWFY